MTCVNARNQAYILSRKPKYSPFNKGTEKKNRPFPETGKGRFAFSAMQQRNSRLLQKTADKHLMRSVIPQTRQEIRRHS